MTEQTLDEALQSCTERCRNMDAPLPARLSAFADDVRRLSPEFADIVERMVSRLQSAGAGSAAPALGEPFPAFLLPDQDGRLVSLDQLLAQGPAVVAFHRGHWCPYCRLNADALARIARQVQAAGASIVAITPEVRRFNGELKADARAAFPILSDLDSGVALELGLAVKVPDEKRAAMTAAGWDISKYMDNDAWILPIPATFVVAADGLIRARFVDPDYRKRMDVEDVLAALRA